MVREFLLKLKKGTEYLNYGRNIIVNWSLNHLSGVNDTPEILDLGLGASTDLLNIRKNFQNNLELYGLESYEPNIIRANENGISVLCFNIESDKFPFDDDTLDIIVANQILEHTKEIFYIFSEVSRILKPSGIFIVGVPNLASLHNRVALLFGLQPPSIQVLGPHVRGFTKESFVEFIECDDFFKVFDVKGSNFYPFSPKISVILAKAFPNLSVSSFYLIQRTDKKGEFINVLNERFFETLYFMGK